MRVGTVAEIWRFPVKSMGGESLPSVEIGRDGIAGDRRWAFRDTESGKIVSAKRPSLWAQLLDFDAVTSGDSVEVTTAQGERVRLDDPSADELLSDAVGRAVTVVRATGAPEVYASEWPEIEGMVLAGDIDLPVAMSTESPSFVDLATLHLLSTTAMATLDGWVGDDVSAVQRFRPGLLLDTDAADGIPEQGWTGGTLTVGPTLRLTVGDASPRCIMTTVAQRGLEKRPDVLRTLAEHNRIEQAFGGFACLGVYAEVDEPGIATVGDDITFTPA